MSLVQIRKLRKKIRQIECLETLDRELTAEEQFKVSQKAEFRQHLQELVGTCTTEISTSVIDHNKSDDTSVSCGSSSLSFENADVDATEESSSSSPQAQELSEELNFGAGGLRSDTHFGDTRTNSTSQVAVTPSLSGDTSPQQKAQHAHSHDTVVRKNGAPKTEDVFIVRSLDGHNGPVTALAMNGDLLVTGSQDTAVKVWSVSTGTQIRSFGGHKQTVTSVLLLSPASSLSFAKLLDTCNDKELSEKASVEPTAVGDVTLVISVSLDCTICVWSVQSGMCLLSVYTFHSLTCLSYIDDKDVIVSGSDGGKLELWSPMAPSSPIQSTLMGELPVTDLVVDGRHIYCSSADGIVSVFEWRESDGCLHLVFESSDVRSAGGDRVCHRYIHCMAVNAGTIYYGDDAMNVKALDWKSGIVRKLTNHMTEFGSTDSVCIAGGFLISSGYDIDNGFGYINVRSMPDESYLYTLCDEQTSRICCVACCLRTFNQLVLASGGNELKLWTMRLQHSDEDIGAIDAVKSVFISRFDKAARHSDAEPDSDSNDSDDVSDEPSLPWHHSHNEEPHRGWLSWCNLT